MLLAAASAWSQTTTGRLIGRVTDEDRVALPGVEVTIASPALIGGAQTQVTDDRGEYSFVGIAPGEYSVGAALDGFIPQERARVKVSLGHAVALIIEMPRGSFTGEITVVDETPVVDPTQVNAGQIFDQDYMQSSAIGSANRSYFTIVNQTAGVAGGGTWSAVPQPRVFGSTVGENAYFIDGVDTTDPVMATGGVPNQFSGTLDVRYRDQSFQESGEHFDANQLDTQYRNLAATLGGPIVRDRLWFFASYQWIDDEDTPVASPTTSDREAESSLAKLTWQIDPSWRLTGKYSTIPSTRTTAMPRAGRCPRPPDLPRVTP
jgi:hypothetical protein